jgi:hypothetical protein
MSTPTLVSGLHASAIAAGDNHSAAIRGDGTLLVWGANASGQVGDGSTTQRTAPTILAAPAGVSTLTLGDLHSAAVSPDGTLSTWGEGGSGRLGDGGIADRLSPFSAMTGISGWIPAAPTVSVPSGTLESAQSVTIASPTAGATIRYTLDGSEPGDADDEVPANGEVAIAYSSMLRARAFVTGRVQSGIARADYVLQSIAPTISPGTASYSTAQTVTLSVTGPPASIRFTLDGTDPTVSSTLYSSPLSINTGLTLKARAFPSNGWASSPASSATFTFNYGDLPAPTASPSTGTFADPQSITLSVAAGATIRYTIDGTEPTSVSNLYVAPVQVSSGTVTLKARAFHADWTPSTIVSESYIIDSVGPTITASRFPGSITSWHNIPTTISFSCADNIGIATCSPPSTFTNEGQGQTVVGTAIDQAGREATVNVTVNVDFTAPDVALTSPGSLSTSTGTSIALTGEVSDQLSGLSAVTCNGLAATVTDGDVNCDVSLYPGINDIVLVARDAAGNSRSAGVRVIRTGTSTVFGLAPAMQTVQVDDALTLKLADDFGSAITGATWTSSDSQIVSVSADDPPVLMALAGGTATITASKNGLSADAILVVVAGPLASGTTRWAVSGLFGAVGSVLNANRVDSSVPDIFSVESGATGTIVRAVTAAGDTQWVAQSPGYPLMADSFGALVAGVDIQPYSGLYTGLEITPRFKAFARFAGPPSAFPWRYDSVGSVQRPAQAPDGTIFALEKYDTGLTDVHGTSIIETQVVVLDGATGQVRTKIPLAREVRGFSCGNEGWVSVPRTVGPIVGNDGYGYVLVRNWTNIRSGGCVTGFVLQDVGVKLLRISPAGAASSTVIYAQHCEHGFSNVTICDQAPNLGDLVPDGIGGMLVRAGYTTMAYNDHTYDMEGRLTRLTPEGVQYDIPSDYSNMLMIGDAGHAFVNDETSIRAMDVTNWTTVWSNANLSLEPVVALPNGGAAMHDPNTGNLVEFTASGDTVQSGPFGGRWDFQSAFGMWTGVDNTGQLTARVSLALNESSSSYGDTGRVGTQQYAPTERVFANREIAALMALEFLYPMSANNNWEYGGLICREGTKFRWSELVTLENQSEVFVSDNLCPATMMAARFHTHPPKELTYPSGGDYSKADQIVAMPNYLMAPIENTALPYHTGFPTRQQFYKYWRPTGQSASESNVCQRMTLTTWEPDPVFSPGANCATPIP